MSANVRHSSEGNEHYTPREFADAARDVMGKIALDPATCAAANALIGAEDHFSAVENGFTRNWWGPLWLNPPGGKCDRDGVTITSAHRDSIGIEVKKEGKGKDSRWSCGKECDHAHEGVAQRWECAPNCGHVHDGVQSSQRAWYRKLVDEWMSGRVDRAVFLSFNLELFQTSQVDRVVHPTVFPISYPRTRIVFFHIDEATGEFVEGGSPPHSSALIYLPSSSSDGEAFAQRFEAFGHVDRKMFAHRLRLSAAVKEAA